MSQHAPYYRWFPKDYASDALVRGMSRDQDLVYRRLLDVSWELGALPHEPEKLAVLAGIPRDTFVAEVWKYPLTECWSKRDDGLLINYRLEEEREKAFSRTESATNAAKAREVKRRKLLRSNKKKAIIESPSKPHRKTIDTPSTSDGNLIGSPSTPDPLMTHDSRLSTQREKSFTGPTVAKEKPAAADPTESKKAATANDIIRWSSSSKDFIGDKPRLRGAVFERYDSHGEKWIQAVWKSCRTWCIDNPEAIEKTKNHYQFVLNWFRREAQRKDERE